MIRLDYVHFTVVLDRARRLAVTSAVNIDGANLVDVERADEWRYDPRVPDRDQVGEEVYADNDLDRGHLVRRRDPVWGTAAVARQANLDTFFYTNAAPQAARFNQSLELWLGLEDYLLQAAQASGARLNVFTGPVLDDDDPRYRGVQIPRRFYKIAAWADTARGGVLAATGYVLDQTDELDRIDLTAATSVSDGIDLGGYRTYQVPITEIAAMTTLDVSIYAAADRLVTKPIDEGTPSWKRLHTLHDTIL